MKKTLSLLLSAWQKLNLMSRILIGIVCGTLLALFLPQAQVIGILGVLFVGALKAIAPVLVAVLVVSSVSKAGNGLGGRFRNVVALYMLSTLFAAVLAVLASRYFPVDMVLSGVTGAENQAPQELSNVFGTIASNLMSNPLRAIAEANYLSILLWAIIIGLALKKVASPLSITAIITTCCGTPSFWKKIVCTLPFTSMR